MQVQKPELIWQRLVGTNLILFRSLRNVQESHLLKDLNIHNSEQKLLNHWKWFSILTASSINWFQCVTLCWIKLMCWKVIPYFKNYYTSCFVLSHQTFTNETTRCHTNFKLIREISRRHSKKLKWHFNKFYFCLHILSIHAKCWTFSLFV